MPEYDPTSVPESAIATPTATPATTPATTGEGYDKALNSERNIRKALEQRNKAIEAELAENKRALEQAQMTLEQKYQADLDASRQSYQAQVDAAIAAEQAKYQAENEARMTAEQRLQMLENQQLASRITSEFANTFAPLLSDPNPLRLQSYIKLIEDDLTVDNQGQPALIVRRDANGYPAELAPIDAAVGYFQNNFPQDFKAPAQQKTGGGARNLASSTVGSSQRQEVVKFNSLADVNKNPKAFLDNMDAIVAGKFQLGDQ